MAHKLKTPKQYVYTEYRSIHADTIAEVNATNAHKFEPLDAYAICDNRNSIKLSGYSSRVFDLHVGCDKDYD